MINELLNQVKEKYTKNECTIAEGKENNTNLLNNKNSCKDNRTTTRENSIFKFADCRRNL